MNKTCAKCGTNLNSSDFGELCPACLMKAGLEDTSPTLGITRPLPPTRLKYFGDYELVETIARGGMGVVYKARQLSLNRMVAVKMILSGQLATEADVQRFIGEAEAAANLQHPNIVSIHEIGLHEGQHYFSMDLVEGENLGSYRLRQSMGAKHAARLLQKLAEAVHYAHQRGTLHRDLKPTNILMDERGEPRITDFGLAKRSDDQNSLTNSGAILGTPSYMPPEQAAGRRSEVGPASDVYALGAVLYFLLTGKAPFSGETPVATMHQVIEQNPIAPSKINSAVPRDLETICLKCLEKSPHHRYHSARLLAEELERFLLDEPILAKPAPAIRQALNWCRKQPWTFAGAGSLTAIVLVAVTYGLYQRVQYLGWKQSQPQTIPQFRHVMEDLGPLLADAVNATFLGIFITIIAAALSHLLKRSIQKKREVPAAIAAGLATAGAVLMLIAVSVEIKMVRAYAWSETLPLPMLIGLGLGTPFLLASFGAATVAKSWRAWRTSWAGELHHLSSPPKLSSNAPRFALVLVMNVILYVAVSSYMLPDGRYPAVPYDPVKDSVQAIFSQLAVAAPNVPYGLGGTPRAQVIAPIYPVLRTSFVMVAVAFMFAPRLLLARKFLPPAVSVFYWLFLVGGGAIFHAYLLPIDAFATALAAGLAGGIILAKLSPLKSENGSALPDNTQSAPLAA